MDAAYTALPATATVTQTLDQPPPIVDILRFAGHATSAALTVVWNVFAYTAHVVWFPAGAIFSPVSYALAPVILFVQIILDAFVFTPVSLATSLAQGFYPVYVFVGTSCLFAACIGLIARGVATLLLHTLFASSGSRPKDGLDSKSPRTPRTPSGTTKLRKKVVIVEGKKK